MCRRIYVEIPKSARSRRQMSSRRAFGGRRVDEMGEE